VAKVVAFSLLVCAAFAWVPPWLDRPGTAALGFAFMALAVGQALPRLRVPPVTRELSSTDGDNDVDEAMIDAYLASLTGKRP